MGREHIDATVIPLRERASFVFLERGVLRASGYSLLLDQKEREILVPVGAAVVIGLEPGVSVTHEAMKLCAEHGTLLLWVGEQSVRVYGAGLAISSKTAERLIDQVRKHLDPATRVTVARRFYERMFGEPPEETRSIEKLRGIEGQKVRALYRSLGEQHGLQIAGRVDAPKLLQQAMGYATACLYGLSEAVILAAGYSPAIGFIHSGDPRSLCFDLADTVKFRTVIPAAFAVYARGCDDVRAEARRACRDLFSAERTIALLFDNLLYAIEGDVCSA